MEVAQLSGTLHFGELLATSLNKVDLQSAIASETIPPTNNNTTSRFRILVTIETNKNKF
jgi:hypothetical protein